MQAEMDHAAQRALELAYGYVNTRERTVAEVAAELQRAGIDPLSAQAAIGELAALGYLDDIRFAKLFAQDKRALEHWGAERIERGLVARGIARELIAATLTESQQETELERALAVLARRFPQPRAGRRERERALGFLLRKGYDGETALEALRARGEISGEFP
jgi:regulatory protein